MFRHSFTTFPFRLQKNKFAVEKSALWKKILFHSWLLNASILFRTFQPSWIFNEIRADAKQLWEQCAVYRESFGMEENSFESTSRL